MDESYWMPETDNQEEAKMDKITLSDFKDLILAKLEAFSRQVQSLDLELCPQVANACTSNEFTFSVQILEHIRTLSHGFVTRDTSLLLTGAQGIGRRNLIHLLSHWFGYTFMTPCMIQAFSLKQFKTFLKDAMIEAAVHGKQICLFLEEFQIVDTWMLNIINDLLSCGEVQHLSLKPSANSF